MYLKTASCYKEYVKFNEKLRVIIVSRMIKIFPEIRAYYVNDMNPEEQILFDAKVVRLESENEIRKKCIDKIYPIDWVYNFEKDVNGREFTKRFRNIVTRMREKTQLLLNQFDYEGLYKDSVELLLDVHQELQNVRENHKDFILIPFEDYREGVRFFEKNQLTHTLSFQIYKQIHIACCGDPTAFASMLYEYSYIRRNRYLKLIKNCWDLFKYSDDSRMFYMRKMVRKYKEIPCVVAYLYKKEYGTVDTQIEHPTSVYEVL